GEFRGNDPEGFRVGESPRGPMVAHRFSGVRYAHTAVVLGKPVENRRGPRHCERIVARPRPYRSAGTEATGEIREGRRSSDDPSARRPATAREVHEGLETEHGCMPVLSGRVVTRLTLLSTSDT